jgi:5-methylcytosine-specific restriction endonuclease McrA
LTAPQRYQVQFTASEEHVELVERAQALLPLDARNGAGLAEIHLRAMRALVAELEKQKFGAPRLRAESGTPQRRRQPAPQPEPPEPAEPPEPPDPTEPTDARWTPHIGEASPLSEAPRRRVRYVPAAERRMVFERDGARCSYVDARGQRCRETRRLELHHLTPFARDGAHIAANLAVFCRAHNNLAAEEDFSRNFVESTRDKVRHESWAVQKPP